jgi:hypothetical protein
MARPAGARRRGSTIVRVPIRGKAEWEAASRRPASWLTVDERPLLLVPLPDVDSVPRRQLEVLRAWIAAGSIAAAAYELGISETTAASSSQACTGERAA